MVPQSDGLDRLEWSHDCSLQTANDLPIPSDPTDEAPVPIRSGGSVVLVPANWQRLPMKVTSAHWLRGVRRCPSPNVDDRPPGALVELVVLHNISLPPGRFGGGEIEALFCNTLDCAADPALQDLEGVRVSAHLLINRRGRITQFVPFNRRAWHAGVSSWAQRPRCNDYAIGIELEGTDDRRYTKRQYRQLDRVLAALLEAYPQLSPERVVGHLEIAPGRKTDPGASFDWSAVLVRCSAASNVS